jgi:hypothetical protein
MAAVGGLDQMRRAVGALLAINPSTQRNWIGRKEIDTGTRPRVSTEVSGELTVLRREVAGLRWAERDPQDRLGVSPRRNSAAYWTCRLGAVASDDVRRGAGPCGGAAGMLVTRG